MIGFIKKNSVLVGGIFAVFIALVVYLNFFAGAPSGDLLAATASDAPVSQDLLSVLSSLHTIKLDDSIFSDPAFDSLTDFGVTLPPENAGRRNPFLPVGAN